MDAATLTVRDVEFSYLERGDRGAPLALVLHGFPDSPVSFTYLLDSLGAAGFHAVAPWLRGFAPTSVAPDANYHAGAVAADANALHEALGGDERAVLIGHDWGAYAAIPALAVAPDRWRRGVTMAVPPPSIMVRAMGSYDQLQRSWYMWLFQTPIAELAICADAGSFIDRLWSQWSPGLDAQRAAESLTAAKAAIAEPAHLSAALGYYRSMFSAPETDDASAVAQAASLSVPSVPVRYLHGVDDGCIGIDSIGDPLDALCEGSSYVTIDDAGHFLQLEQPQSVADAVLTFLSN